MGSADGERFPMASSPGGGKLCRWADGDEARQLLCHTGPLGCTAGKEEDTNTW